jgi:hypothetical protein
MTDRVGLVVASAALAGRLAAGAAALVAPPAAGAQEPSPPPAAGEPASEPAFRPGIPGLKMVDVREHKLLWREIEELQRWEQADRISIAEYRSKVIEKTAQFLGLGGAAGDGFRDVASRAVTAVRDAFSKWRADGDPTALEARFSSELRASQARIAALLGKEPRHQLFASDCKKWLLKLAFGPKEAKETRDAKQRTRG